MIFDTDIPASSAVDKTLSALVEQATRLQHGRVEATIVRHFGSKERAVRMVTLFPGRYSMTWFGSASPFDIFRGINDFPARSAPPGTFEFRDPWTGKATRG